VAVYSFNGSDLLMMLRGAVNLLGQAKNEIDALNVFPVPDGDTGTNMYQTIEASLKEALETDSNHIGHVALAAARGALMGARGNSGVILSQVLQGFAGTLQAKEKATASDISLALQEGVQMAYRAVMKPVEGTILTVVRKSAEEAAALRSRNLLRMMVAISRSALNALQETPDLLPALKQAGVVDAGGKGFVVILEGFLQALKSASPLAKETVSRLDLLDAKVQPELTMAVTALDFTYCTEFLLKGEGLPLSELKRELIPYGDCLMVVGNELLAKVHIHSNHPGLVLECCLKYGKLYDLKITNMEEQQREQQERLQVEEQTSTSRPFGILSVGYGEGLKAIMKSLGADVVLDGGQTLNPSTGDLLKGIDEVPAKRVILLPNNKNIILAAEQAGRLSGKETLVIPSRSIPQGLSALLALAPEEDFETTARKMERALTSVRTGEITTAVRDYTGNDGLTVKKGHFMGLADGEIVAAGMELAGVLEKLLTYLVEGEGRLVTLYYGQAMERKEVLELADSMASVFKGQDFDVQDGGQPVYHLIISVE
jgi:DAK2 domain fusion protein YloV